MFVLLGGTLWGSYLLVAYGVSQVAGYNVGFADLAIPGRTIDRTKDVPGAATAATTPLSGAPTVTGSTGKQGTISKAGSLIFRNGKGQPWTGGGVSP